MASTTGRGAMYNRPMVYAVAVLLISSLTTVGLIAVWAATSPGNWFWRTMAFLGAMSPLLLIPAFEPFVAFVIQGTVVAAGVTVVPWRNSKQREPPAFSRYSLRTVLALIVPIAIVVATTSSTHHLNRQAWQTVIAVGVGGGFATLTAWWIATRKACKWWVRLVVAILVSALVGSALARTDWFIICLENFANWPPDVAGTDWGMFGSYDKGDKIKIWYFIIGVEILFTNYLLQEGLLICGRVKKLQEAIHWTLNATTFIFVSIVAIGPAVFVVVYLLNRYPVPRDHPPSPNGFDDFLAARDLMPKIRFVDSQTFGFWEASKAELQQATDELASALLKVDEGLTKPTSIDIDYFSYDYPDALLDDFGSLQWGIRAQGKSAECDGNYDVAASCYLKGIAFACASSRGGLVSHDFDSCRHAEVGFRLLYDCIEKLPRDKISLYVDQLRDIEAQHEPAEDFVHRSTVCEQRYKGWYGHLMHGFGRIFLYRFFEWDSYIGDRTVCSTISRLLQTELALRAYQADHEACPDRLADLVPQYLPEVPVDPCSLDNSALRYQRDGDRFIVYSVGHNRKDDHGEKSSQSLSYAMHGDIWLEDWYAPAEE